MAPVVFPDNTVFCNFAAVERIDLLIAWLRGRGRWCEAVHHETTRSARCLSALTQLTGNGSPLGDPIIIDDPSETQKINRIREVVFGGSIDKPTQHLGEAQTCWVIRHRAEFRGSWWVTDDIDAYEYASMQGITTYRTRDIMAMMISDGDLSEQEAWNLMKSMADAERPISLPRSVQDLL